jgi:hypothetical protein
MNDRVNPERVPLNWKIVASGYLPEYLYEEGRLADTSLSFPELQRHAHVNDRAMAADSAPDFSRRIRAWDDVPTSSAEGFRAAISPDHRQ